MIHDNHFTAQRCTDPIPGQAQRPRLTPPPPPPAPSAEQFRRAAERGTMSSLSDAAQTLCQRKMQIEKQIVDLLQDFTRETGIGVDGLHCTTAFNLSAKSASTVVSVEMSLRFDK